MTAPRIVVIGAGIAGNALTVALNRRGIIPTVVEAADHLDPGGFAVDLRGNSQAVLASWGVLDAVKALRVPEERMVAVGPDGEVLWATPPSRSAAVADLEIGRGDLNRVLTDAGRADRVMDARVAAVASHGSAVRIRTTSDFVLDADLLVGADGISSQIRRSSFPQARIRYLGGCIGYVPVPYPSEFRGDMRALSIPGGVMVAVRPSREGGYALVAVRHPAALAIPRDPAVRRAMMADRLAAVGGSVWQVPAILRAMRATPEWYVTMLERVRTPMWADGPIALLGDAAWCGSPLTGRGTAMAIMGAEVLAEEIAQTPHAPADAVARYDRRMRSWRRWGHAHASRRTLQSWAPMTRTGVAFNALAMRTITRTPRSASTGAAGSGR